MDFKFEMSRDEFFGWLKVQSEADQEKLLALVLATMDLGFTAPHACIVAYNVFVASPTGMMSDGSGTKH